MIHRQESKSQHSTIQLLGLVFKVLDHWFVNIEGILNNYICMYTKTQVWIEPSVSAQKSTSCFFGTMLCLIGPLAKIGIKIACTEDTETLPVYIHVGK